MGLCCGTRTKSEELLNAMKKQGVWGEAVATQLEASFDAIKKAMAEGKADAPDPQTLVKATLKAIHKEMAKIYKKIWDKYDADKNGKLSKAEMNKMTKEALEQQRDIMPKVMEVTFLEFQQIALDLAKKQGVSGALLDSMKENMDKEFKKSKATFTKEIQKMFKELIDDHEKIATSMYNAMDVDKDGKVTKKEFLEKYGEASAKVLSVDSIMSRFE